MNKLNKSIKKGDLNRFIANLMKKHEVIAPIKKQGHHFFEKLENPDDLNLNFINTHYPPKRFFLPPHEELFTLKNKKVSYELDNTKRVIFGLRPCDVNSLLILDKLFLDGIPDPYYKRRRKNNLIIALDCIESGKNCFCTSLGTNKMEDGYDLLFTEKGGRYIVKVGTVEGKALLSSKFFKSTKEEFTPKLSCKKKISEEEIEKIRHAADSDAWNEESDDCLSCCACTVACPTCSCFEVEDFPDMDGKESKRIRRWSSCQLNDFSKVAGEFVFRKERDSKVKHRIRHKFEYFKDQYGIYMCVGCGRCIDYCPKDSDMIKTIKKIK
ncbi:MAG: hypothetical protein GY861_07000 [bacterium]|nr:hypothetical protein [bacterium]